MKEELKLLKDAREEFEACKINDQILEAEYLSTQEFQNWAANRDYMGVLKEQIQVLEDQIREEAVELSRKTGFEERKFGAVSIKEYTKVNILDHKQAVVWAAQNAPSCLSLTKDFDKAAKNLELPFATIEKEYKAFIASDLSGYVEDESADNSEHPSELS